MTSMAASVNEPFLLASYTLPKRFSRPRASTSNLYATHQHASTSTSEGYVTAAAQGDGIHILDLASLHPVVSHTLGPSTTFACPSISRIASEDGVRTCTTYAALESAQGVKSDERGRVVRMWRSKISGDLDSAGAQNTAKTAILSHRVRQIYAHEELPDSIIFLGEHGEITVTTSNIDVKYSQASEGSVEVLNTFAFGRLSATFVPRRWAVKGGFVVIMIVKVKGEVRIRVYGVADDESSDLGDFPLPVQTEVLDSCCSPSGFISLLTPYGEWHSLQLETSDYTSLTLSTPSPHVTLKSLSFIIAPKEASQSAFTEELSTLSLGSSHVLLAGITSGSSPEIAILLWDLQYSVVLTSRLIPIPSSLQRTKKQGIRIRLAGTSSNAQQAFLILSPKPLTPLVNGTSGSHAPSDDASQRSSILVIPLTVPSTSSVANAIGRAAAGERWLSASGQTRQIAVTTLEGTQNKLLRMVRSAVDQKKVDVADETYFAWVTKNESTKNIRLVFGYQFVKQLLDIVLRPSVTATNIPYSPKIVQHLLRQRCVSASMVDSGLFAVLRLRNDWESIMLAMKTVIDIPEDDVVRLLQTSVAQSLKDASADDDAMQVDTAAPGSVPTVHTILPLCATYTMSAPALRLALRQHLRDAGDLLAVLQILNQWIDAHCDESVPLLPERTKRDAHGALLPVHDEKQKAALPPLDAILAFLQTLLDTSFLTFLTYPPSHGVLRRILAHIEPELDFIDDVDQLRGPLEPFLRAHAKAVHEATYGAQKPDLKVDWRRRRKEAHEQAGMAIGVYQLEELVI